MVFDFKFEVNDSLASQTIREAADVAKKALENSSEMSKNFSIQEFLNSLGNIVQPIIQNVFQAENIMPMLLGMMMGNNGFSPAKTDAAVKDDSEKPTQADEEKPESTQE